MTFITKLRPCKIPSYNPLTRIVEEVPYDPIHEYDLRTNNSPKTINRRERFKNYY